MNRWTRPTIFCSARPFARFPSCCLGCANAGGGGFIALTSMAVREPIANLALSNVMRAGLTGYLKTLAGEVAGDGVLVNSVCTGMFLTERLLDLARAPPRHRASRSKP